MIEVSKDEEREREGKAADRSDDSVGKRGVELI